MVYRAGSHARVGRILEIVGVLALLLSALSGCALPGFALSPPPRPAPTAAANFSGLCPTANPHDIVLKGGANDALQVRSLDAEELRFAQSAAADPSQASEYWAGDVVEVNTGLLDTPGLAAGASQTTPQDFGCVVAAMQRGQVTQRAFQALEQDAAALSGPPTSVYLFAAPIAPWFPSITQSWESGFSGREAIAFYFWAPAPDLAGSETNPAGDWWSGIAHTVAHEYFEVVRYQAIGYYTAYANLLANLVTDGMAESFAGHQIGADSPFDRLLTVAQESSVWQQIRSQITSSDVTLDRDVMFGNRAKGIPPDAGYGIGFHIVQGYLKRHPGTTYSELAGLDAQTVLAQSGYTG